MRRIFGGHGSRDSAAVKGQIYGGFVVVRACRKDAGDHYYDQDDWRQDGSDDHADGFPRPFVSGKGDGGLDRKSNCCGSCHGASPPFQVEQRALIRFPFLLLSRQTYGFLYGLLQKFGVKACRLVALQYGV
ncbi:hypothetical protein SDC9_54578 [bioreactor metagenome]|uniref:Uncharacterized protein n=1 Tax=bioreactor metagenome TaxID=1076179 RepID=A0A644WWG8_9ZZZZ